MNNNTLYAPQPAALPSPAPAAARVIFRLLRELRHGTLEVQLPDGNTTRFGTGEGPRAVIRLRNWNVCAAALKSGDIGFAESYIAGDWTAPDLTTLLELLIANRKAIEALLYGSWWGSLLYRAKHLLNRNTRSGSRKNIHAHYDLGNEFYRLWLDDTMSYSSAWFGADRSQPMEQAQQAKVRRALVEAGVTAGARVLEVGCGWGGLAEVAARDFGARITGVTLSQEQLTWARERMARQQLPADLRLQDYRDISDAPFDAVVSIEMFEAVGREYWAGYFDMLKRCLKPGGRACIQSITIRDDLFERYVKSTDFIQQYIFPGGLLPSIAAFHAEAARAGMAVEKTFAFGGDYAETLRRWRERFLRHEPQVRSIGFDDRFLRIWEFYLAYCEAAFATGNTDVVQFTLRRP
ncbi:SAM-dependent methyltransferase [Methylibium rhizosphaerae]|uniref:SAM-dependent methyltransferase n=1 Tax=Methylibium rhizosphaerae TaxID=2570323 RepID=UPI00112C4593|nr:cyclopropane-fatty-acyl-phospholipid synthase family protein [Methylibium rhizosphaerae]